MSLWGAADLVGQGMTTMKDYRGLYEDLLAMERRAKDAGEVEFAAECRAFRVDLLMRHYHPIGHVRIA